MGKYKFNYNNLDDLKNDIKNLDLKCPIQKDINILLDKIKVGKKVISNRLAIHPMEGCDSNSDGSPGELTLRRYKRYAHGGAGLIWVEAVAVNESGRANGSQLYLNENTVNAFKKMVDMIKKESLKIRDKKINPYLVIQLAHSGRFGKEKNILFHHKPIDKAAGISENARVMSDKELDQLENDFFRAAKLAKRAGFDAVDIKSCHRYLLSENLAAYTRSGKYGGSYENRTKLLKNVIKKIQQKIDIDIAVRMNVYDSIPYPYGWGSDKDGNEDHSEPKRLVKELEELGVKLINITAATPYIYPHITRPYDFRNNLSYEPPEHPLVGVVRLLNLSRVMNKETKNTKVVGTGFSWLRQFAPNVASAVIKNKWMDIAGFGRMAFAYPNFAKDIINTKEIFKNKVCITCSKCAELKAKKKKTGCVVRDSKIYLPIYKELIEDNQGN